MWGKTTGKVGGLVYASSGGEQIVREYNPNVSNPSTSAQVNQRARMKLMSQLSAALSPVLAMSKTGLVSARNKFTKRNMQACYASNGTAQITYENVQITEGHLGLPTLSGQAAIVQDDRQLYLGFTENPSANIARVVYSVFVKNSESDLSFVQSLIVSERMAQGDQVYFRGVIDNVPSGELVVFAYGMIDTTAKASALYGNLNVQNGTDLAQLVATRTISTEDFQFTQTRGITLGTDGMPITPTTPGQWRVWLTASGSGTVNGAGSYADGTEVTLTATPGTNATFVKWLVNGTQQTYSTNNPLVIAAIHNNLDLVAVFNGGGKDSL